MLYGGKLNVLLYQSLNVSLNVCLFYREEVGHSFVEVLKVLMILRIKKLMELLIIEQRVKPAQFCNLMTYIVHNNKVVEFKHYIISIKLLTANMKITIVYPFTSFQIVLCFMYRGA